MNSNNPVADQIWAMIDNFRGYSFCKAHSASYTRISFESAYLRRHHPAEFMAAVISNGGGFYSTSAYISECLRMGLTVLPIDINESQYHYKGFQKNVRIGFMAVKGLPEKTIKTIIKERKENGHYLSLYDYLHRTDTSFIDNQKLNNLDAFAKISPWNTSQIYWQMHEFYRSRNASGQLQLFPPSEKTPPVLNAPTIEEKRNHQMNMLGYLVNQHPFVLWETQITKMNVVYQPATEISKHIGENITLLGFPITKKLAKTRKGDSMAFYSFEDQHAIYDVTLFPKAYERYKNLVIAESPCFLHGLVESEFGAESVTIHWILGIQNFLYEAQKH
jgi:error-prone DNA polymerase